MSSEAEKFLGISESKGDRSNSGVELPFLNRALVFSITWVAALMGASPSLVAIKLLPFFPLGLAMVFPFSRQIFKNEFSAVGAGWCIYLALSIAVMTSSTKKRFYKFYAILLILLLCNVAGCHSTWSGMSNVH